MRIVLTAALLALARTGLAESDDRLAVAFRKAGEAAAGAAAYKATPQWAGPLELRLNQWADHSRSQYYGNCFVHAAVAIAEAACYRRNSRPLHLNEDDLFLNQHLLNLGRDGVFYSFCQGGACKFDEGGDDNPVVKYLFKNGAALVVKDDAEADYLRREFAETLATYEGSLKGSFEAVNAGIHERIKESIKSGEAPMNELEKCKLRTDFCRKSLNAPQVAHLRKVVAEEAGLWSESGQKIDEDGLTRMRQEVKGKLRGYRLYEKIVATGADGDKAPGIPEKECMATPVGREIVRALKAALDAGYPVDVGMDLAGLAEWGEARPETGTTEARKKGGTGGGDAQDDESVGHVFVITGYSPYPEPHHFLTRNSWGPAKLQRKDRPDNPDLLLGQVCRISAMSILLAPGEPELPKELGFKLIATAPGQ